PLCTCSRTSSRSDEHGGRFSRRRLPQRGSSETTPVGGVAPVRRPRRRRSVGGAARDPRHGRGARLHGRLASDLRVREHHDAHGGHRRRHGDRPPRHARRVAHRLRSLARVPNRRRRRAVRSDGIPRDQRRDRERVVLPPDRPDGDRAALLRRDMLPPMTATALTGHLRWNWDPIVLAGLVGSAVVYARGLRSLWRRGAGRSVSLLEASAFLGGLIVVAVALLSPVDTLAASLFWVHMSQHMLLIVVAAP